MFNLSHSSTNQELFEKHLGNHWKIRTISNVLLERKPSHAIAQIFLIVSKDVWNRREDTDKSMKNTTECQKVPFRLK